MNPCDDCPIDDKIYECCGRHPETGAVAPFTIGKNRLLFACPQLNTAGKCKIYDNRPYACQAHHCYGYDTMNNVGDGYRILSDQWNVWHEDDNEMEKSD
ncbi:MAG: hypothetical protein HF978_16500 [Desulfobacteraceae bacterium]|nr:hypothetical protein [Desulfobacteraceae bacterium]MBC2757144.1 hypothetical protein [Desulfobacteraceae bacterium]